MKSRHHPRPPSPFNISLNIAESDILSFENLNKEFQETLQQYEMQKKQLLDNVRSPPSTTPIRCGVNHFCVNVKDNTPQCFGDDQTCLWNKVDCNTDSDCTAKYNADTSPKYVSTLNCSNAASATSSTDTWSLNACQLAQASTTDTQTLNALNLKLINLSYAIQDQINTMQTSTDQQWTSKELQAQLLVKKYDILLEERAAIEQALLEHQNADEEYKDQQIVADMNNSRFLLWLFFCGLVILYLVKVIFFPDMHIEIFRSLLMASLGFLFVVATFYLYIPQIFFLWVTVIAFLFLSFYKIIPF
jgi:hypothetical protein